MISSRRGNVTLRKKDSRWTQPRLQIFKTYKSHCHYSLTHPQVSGLIKKIASSMADITMAQTSKNSNNPEQEKHAKVPVLTVLKNNAVLKNIFLVHDGNNEDQTVLIGRHPDCNIVLMHPSVSRFHLRIRSNPSSHTLSLVDLASGAMPIKRIVFCFFFSFVLSLNLDGFRFCAGSAWYVGAWGEAGAGGEC